MHQHLRASLMTLCLLALVTAVAVFFRVMASLVSAEMIPIIVAVLGIGVCIYLIYMMFLTQIRYEDRLTRLVDKK
jgi:uncharacterized membrane-anchored protein